MRVKIYAVYIIGLFCFLLLPAKIELFFEKTNFSKNGNKICALWFGFMFVFVTGFLNFMFVFVTKKSWFMFGFMQKRHTVDADFNYKICANP